MTDKQKAWTISIGIHLLLLLLLYLVVFMPPDPPLDAIVMGGGSGVELNFGTDDVGSGTEQSLLPGGENLNQQSTENNPKPEETASETPSEPSSATEETPDKTDEDSPVEVPKKEEKPKKEVRTPDKTTPDKPKTETVKPQPIPAQPKLDDRAVMSKKTVAKTEGKGKNGASEGDDAGKTGNKGKPDGSLDGRAFYGKNGSGGNGNGGNGNGIGSGDGNGASMNVPGWRWVARPNPADNSSETGKIVFVVRIDEDGKVVSCTVKEATVSPSVTAVYKKVVIENTEFVKTTAGDPAPLSTGTITFIITSK